MVLPLSPECRFLLIIRPQLFRRLSRRVSLYYRFSWNEYRLRNFDFRTANSGLFLIQEERPSALVLRGLDYLSLYTTIPIVNWRRWLTAVVGLVCTQEEIPPTVISHRLGYLSFVAAVPRGLALPVGLAFIEGEIPWALVFSLLGYDSSWSRQSFFTAVSKWLALAVSLEFTKGKEPPAVVLRGPGKVLVFTTVPQRYLNLRREPLLNRPWPRILYAVYCPDMPEIITATRHAYIGKRDTRHPYGVIETRLTVLNLIALNTGRISNFIPSELNRFCRFPTGTRDLFAQPGGNRRWGWRALNVAWPSATPAQRHTLRTIPSIVGDAQSGAAVTLGRRSKPDLDSTTSVRNNGAPGTIARNREFACVGAGQSHFADLEGRRTFVGNRDSLRFALGTNMLRIKRKLRRTDANKRLGRSSSDSA